MRYTSEESQWLVCHQRISKVSHCWLYGDLTIVFIIFIGVLIIKRISCLETAGFTAFVHVGWLISKFAS